MALSPRVTEQRQAAGMKTVFEVQQQQYCYPASIMSQTTYVNDVIRRFRDQLRIKGQYSSTSVAAALRQADPSQSGRLTIVEFERQLRAVGLFMGRYEMQAITRRFGGRKENIVYVDFDRWFNYCIR